MEMEEGLWVYVCVPITLVTLSPSHPHCRGWSPSILLRGKRLSSGLSLVHWILTERDTKRWKYEGTWGGGGGGGGVGFDSKRSEDAGWAGRRRRSGMRGEVQRERRRRREEVVGRREEEGRTRPCRAQSSLFSLTKNSSSSGNPVPQDMTIWIKASITSHNAWCVCVCACMLYCRCVPLPACVGATQMCGSILKGRYSGKFIRMRRGTDRKRERERQSGLIDGDDNGLVGKGGTDDSRCFISVSK